MLQGMKRYASIPVPTLAIFAVSTAHTVRLRGADHYVYLSNEADGLREMKSFFSTLRLQGPDGLHGSCGQSKACKIR